MSRVLVVDDEENIRLVLQTLLRKHGYDVEVAENAERALILVDSFGPDFVLADVKMPGISGIELCAEIKARSSTSTVIVMSAYGSEELALEAIRAGAYDYMPKPFKQDEVLFMLRKAEERVILQRENRALREAARKQHSFNELLGKSAKMQQVYRTIEKVAEYRTTVLIQGESGTGKELVARAIHRLSPRTTKPFVAINCGAIPESLIESELFGHKKGAFTDAHMDKQGIFQEADHGTLFLDEIGDLPHKLQVKLLRALQEGRIRKLGDNQDIAVDVRVIAATIRDLVHEVEQGRFREDLYYRLNVLPIPVPPLRERADDISLLVDHFLEKNNARLGTQIRGIDNKARKLLMNYHWPGNVRELENLIERAVVLAENPVLSDIDLPDRLKESTNPMSHVLSSNDLSIKKAVRLIEEALIRRALEKTKGNRTAASKLLEISHRALLYKIKDYGVD